jgi:hypothetical protein
VCPEDAFEIGIAGRCRESIGELAARRHDASRKKEIERYGSNVTIAV